LRVIKKKKKKATLRQTAGGGKSLWEVDARLPGKGNSSSHGARPVHLTITMIKWIRTSRLSIKNSLSRKKKTSSAIDSGLWEGRRESRRCSRDTYIQSYITKYTSIPR